MRNGKGWWKRFCKFWKSINKREEPSDRIEEIQNVTDPEEKSEFETHGFMSDYCLP